VYKQLCIDNHSNEILHSDKEDQNLWEFKNETFVKAHNSSWFVASTNSILATVFQKLSFCDLTSKKFFLLFLLISKPSVLLFEYILVNLTLLIPSPLTTLVNVKNLVIAKQESYLFYTEKT